MSDTKIEIIETQGSQPAQEPQKTEVKAAPVQEPKYVRLEDLEKVNQAINNTRDYNNRKLQEINEKLEKLIPKAPEPKPDDLDELVQKDWKLGVREVVKSVLTEHSAKKEAESAEQFEARIRQESISKVMSAHPDLSDPSSEKAKTFQKVLEENPDFVTNPRGPILTMYEMQNRLNQHGNINTGGEKVSKEVRSRATSVPAGTSPSGKSNYSLSKQDMDFCRLNGINPENYKKLKGLKEAQV